MSNKTENNNVEAVNIAEDAQIEIIEEKEEKSSKIIFSEKIDSAINGYALAITFIAVSVFLVVKNDYFFYPIISYIIGVVSGVIGILGLGVELSKNKSIKGIGSFWIGATFLVLWAICYFNFNNVFTNIVTFSLLFGLYPALIGLFQIIYSIFVANNSDDKKENKNEKIKNIFLILTQIFGLILTTLNILKIIGVIDKWNK